MPPLHKIKNKEIKLAFKSDCETVLNEFDQLNTFEFRKFAELWQKHKFSLIFLEAETTEDYFNFLSTAFFILKMYIKEGKTIYSKIGALFLMYGLYYKQPIEQQTKIRLTHPDYTILKDLLEEMKSQKHYDPVYVFCKLQQDDAFEYVYNDTVVAPEIKQYRTHFVKNNEIYESVPSEALLADLKDEKVLEEIDRIDEYYRKTVDKFKESFPEAKSLQIFGTRPASAVKEIIHHKDVHETKTCQGEKRKYIKKKAMKAYGKSSSCTEAHSENN